MRQQIRDICSILCGLVVAMDYRKGQKLITDRDFKANADFFQDVFEVGRRYKIMNPGVHQLRNSFASAPPPPPPHSSRSRWGSSFAVHPYRNSCPFLVP